MQLSDTHFGTEQPEVVEALLYLVWQQSPDVVVISGDITQRARRRQFRAAQTFINRMAVPDVLIIPGNHDIPLFNLLMRVFYPYANYHRAFGMELEPMFESSDLLIIGVNTTRAFRHTKGEVSASQINRVSQRLQRATEKQLRIVITHQPVHVTRTEDETNLLNGNRQAVYEWARAGADLILGGHIHLPYVRPLGERFPDLSRRIWTVQAGTAVSSRTRGGIPNSVNLIRHTTLEGCRRCVITRWDHDRNAQRFILVARYDVMTDVERAGQNATDQKLL